MSVLRAPFGGRMSTLATSTPTQAGVLESGSGHPTSVLGDSGREVGIPRKKEQD